MRILIVEDECGSPRTLPPLSARAATSPSITLPMVSKASY